MKGTREVRANRDNASAEAHIVGKTIVSFDMDECAQHTDCLDCPCFVACQLGRTE